MSHNYKPSTLEDWIGRSDIPLAAKVHRYVRRPKEWLYAWRKPKRFTPHKRYDRRDKEWWINGVLIMLGRQSDSNRAKLLTFSRRSNRYLRHEDMDRLNLRGSIGQLAPEHPDCFPKPPFRPKRYRLPGIWSVGALEADVWRIAKPSKVRMR